MPDATSTQDLKVERARSDRKRNTNRKLANKGVVRMERHSGCKQGQKALLRVRGHDFQDEIAMGLEETMR